jgi:hypothetical protein
LAADILKDRIRRIHPDDLRGRDAPYPGSRMVINEVSIDPRRVLQAYYSKTGNCWMLTIALLYGETIQSVEQYYTDLDKLIADLSRLDAVCYKGELADLVSSVTVDETETDAEECKIGFK